MQKKYENISTGVIEIEDDEIIEELNPEDLIQIDDSLETESSFEEINIMNDDQLNVYEISDDFDGTFEEIQNIDDMISEIDSIDTVNEIYSEPVIVTEPDTTNDNENDAIDYEIKSAEFDTDEIVIEKYSAPAAVPVRETKKVISVKENEIDENNYNREMRDFHIISLDGFDSEITPENFFESIQTNDEVLFVDSETLEDCPINDEDMFEENTDAPDLSFPTETDDLNQLEETSYYDDDDNQEIKNNLRDKEIFIDLAELIDGKKSSPATNVKSQKQEKIIDNDNVDKEYQVIAKEYETAVNEEIAKIEEEKKPKINDTDDYEFDEAMLSDEELSPAAEDDNGNEMLLLSEDDLIENFENEISQFEPAEKKTEEKIIEKENIVYHIPESSAISNNERESIFKDLSKKKALVIEENIEDTIRKIDTLKNYSDEVTITYKTSIPDITDSVVLLEDNESVETFLSDMPPEKKEDMKRLLSYLDGLFEKLPEDVIKNFAQSEYFNLYIKVMNELGA